MASKKNQNKTRETPASVADFLDGVAHPVRQADARVVAAMMEEISGEPARMWGSSLVGYGQYHYRYDSGREGDMFRVGFSPRKANLVLYIVPGFGHYDALMARLGKHKTGRSCLYVNKLADIDLEVLRELIVASVAHMADKYPADSNTQETP